MAKKVYQKKKDGELELKGYLPDKTPIEGVGNSVSVAGTTKTVYALSPSALFVPGGLIMGGTAQAAGLVTRGICGVGTPDSTTGACVKDCLYLNYDGDNSYGRKVVLGAGSPGTQLDGGAYTYAAVRGDQMKAYIDKQGFAKASEIGDGDISIYQNGQEVGRFSLNQESGAQINLTDTDTHVDIVDNLDSTSSVAALSAYQGKKLNEKINELKSNGIPVVKVTALPTAAKGLMGKIYIIAHTGHSDDNDYYDEYIVIENKPSSSSVATTYAWEKIGNTDVKLDGYLKTTDIIDALDNQSATNPLSSKQGYLLNQKITEVKTNLEDNYLQIDDYNRQQEDLQHEVTTNSSNIATNKASIASLTSAVNDRYTKGEIVDNSYAVYMPRIDVGADPSAFPAQNKVNFNEIGNGSWIGGLGYPWWHIMTMQGEDTNYFTQIAVMMAFGDTPQLAFRNKAGEDSWAVAISDKTIGSQHVAEADTATKAETLYMPRKTGMNPDSMAGDLAVERTRVFETNAGTAIGGLGIEWWHVFTNASQDPDFATQFAIMMAYSNTPYFAYRSKQSGAWKDWAVAISDKTIGSQHVAVADTYTYGRGVYLDSTSVNDSTSWVKAVFGDEGNTKFHITEVRTMSTSPANLLADYSSGIAWKGSDTFGALTVRYSIAEAYLTGGNGTSPKWGAYVVLSSKGSDISDQSVAYAEKSGYANAAGKAAECSSTTLLKAEGTNLGAKIQSQYTSGAVGNVTYNQATWYVVGNDGETYNLGKMVTTDNFKSELTEALKTTSVEYCTKADNTSTLDSGNYTSSSLSLTYDSSNTTGLTYQSWPKLTIKSNTGFGIVRGGVDGKGAFQIACGVDGHSLFYRYVKDNASPYGWVRLLTESNLSVVDNLTSTSAEAPLSANQGRILNNKFSNYQPSLGSGTGATMQWLSFKNGSSYSISGIWCTKVEMTIEGSVGNQANANFTVDTTYQSSFSNGTWYFVAMPSSGGYINTLSWGLESNSSNTGGVLYALRVYSGVKTTYKFNVIGIRLY